MLDNSTLGIALFLILESIVILCISLLFSIRDDDDLIDDIIDNNADNFRIDYVNVVPADIVHIPGRSFLYYSLITYNVFVLFVKDGMDCLKPFINNNHKCKYIHGQVVEVVNDKIIAIVNSATLPN